MLYSANASTGKPLRCKKVFDAKFCTAFDCNAEYKYKVPMIIATNKRKFAKFQFVQFCATAKYDKTAHQKLPEKIKNAGKCVCAAVTQSEKKRSVTVKKDCRKKLLSVWSAFIALKITSVFCFCMIAASR